MTAIENLNRVLAGNESWPSESDRAEIAARTVETHKCKFHGYSHDYVKHECGHEYCALYWKACPRCYGHNEETRISQVTEADTELS